MSPVHVCRSPSYEDTRLRVGNSVCACRGWQLIADLPCLQVEAQCRDLQHDVQAPRKAERRIIIILRYSSKAGSLDVLAPQSNVS